MSRKLETIPYNAFGRCCIKNLIIPDSVIQIEDDAFEGCPLETLYMSKKLEKIGYNTFYKSKEHHISEVIWPKNSKLVIEWVKERSNVDIWPIDPWSMVEWPFIEKLILPQHIGNNRLNLPYSKRVFRTKAEKKIFLKYHSKEETVDNSEVDYSKLDTTKTIEMQDLQLYRERGERVISVSGVDVIGEYAFAEFQDLEEIRIEEGVRVLARGAFAFCKKLKRVILPESLELIDDDAFHGCENLVEIVTIKEEKEAEKQSKSKKEANYTEREKRDLRQKIPKKVFRIGDRAFAGCKSLGNIVFLGNIERIGLSAFEGCEYLESVEFKGDVLNIEESAFMDDHNLNTVKFGDKILTIGSKAFSGCFELHNIELQRGLESIGSYAFNNCKRLGSIESFIIPETVRSIGKAAFGGCEGLKNIELPVIPKIEEEMFIKCKKLSTVHFAEGTEEISACAFQDCESLQTLEFPHSMKKLGERAFQGCKILEGFTAYGKLQRAANTFEDCNEIVETDSSLERNKLQVKNGKIYTCINPKETKRKNPLKWIKNALTKMKVGEIR